MSHVPEGLSFRYPFGGGEAKGGDTPRGRVASAPARTAGAPPRAYRCVPPWFRPRPAGRRSKTVRLLTLVNKPRLRMGRESHHVVKPETAPTNLQRVTPQYSEMVFSKACGIKLN